MRSHKGQAGRFARVALLAALLIPVAVYGQDRSNWSTAGAIRDGLRGTVVGTVTNIDRTGRTITVRLDEDNSTVRVSTDDVTTSFRAFGDGSATDVKRGSNGLTQVKSGDRLMIQGVGGRNATIAATDITLLGRATSTSTTSSSSRTTTATRGVIEGVVRSVNSTEGRVVVETSDRQLYTVRGDSTTPVYYNGATYRLSNLEAGDSIRVTLMSSSANEDRARSIDVLRDVSATAGNDTRRLTSEYGRITRIDTRNETLRLSTDREHVITVDLHGARDRTGRDIRMSDLHVGDSLEVSGSYDSNNVFRADTVRLGGTRDDTYQDDRTTTSSRDDDYQEDNVFDTGDYRSVTIEVTVEDTFSTPNVLTVRDRAGNRDRISLLVDEDLIVRTGSGYITASQLRVGERLSVRAFETPNGTYIAQTIRVR